MKWERCERHCKTENVLCVLLAASPIFIFLSLLTVLGTGKTTTTTTIMESGKFDFSPSSLKFGSYDLRVIRTFFPLIWFRSHQWSKMILSEWISGLLFGVPGLRHALSLFFSRWNMWEQVCKNVILYQRDKVDTWKSSEVRGYREINRDFQGTCWIYGSKPAKLSLAFSVWLNNPF